MTGLLVRDVAHVGKSGQLRTPIPVMGALQVAVCEMWGYVVFSECGDNVSTVNCGHLTPEFQPVSMEFV